MKKKILLVLISGIWAALVGTGLALLYTYEATPGESDFVASHWPEGSAVVRGDKDYQLIMVAHPHCPCTRASLGELELLLARTDGNLDVHMLFSKPRQYPEKWLETRLFQKAAKIPGIQVVVDVDGQEAKLFGGTTSGQTFLFDREGRLIFSGGITASRGHSGDNLGRSAITEIVRTGKTDLQQTPFFGCALRNEQAQQKDDAAWRL